MKIQKKNIVIIIFLIALSLTSFFLFKYKPKTGKYTKAKLVYEHLTFENSGKWENES